MKLFALILAGSLMTGAAFGQFAAPTTTTTTTNTTNLPSVGIGSMETVQVILTNTAVASTAAGATAPSCTGSVSFYGSTGTQIGTPTTFTLTSNQITSVTLPYASAGSQSTRALVRPVISVTTTRPNPTPCALSYTLSTFSGSAGVTTAFIGQGIVNGSGLIPIHF
jgi:hypothetical protein